jgi:hypothetical protein
MMSLRGIDNSRLIASSQATPTKTPVYWSIETEGWFKTLFRMAFYLNNTGFNTNPSGAITIFQKAYQPDTQWEKNNAFASLKVSQIREIRDFLLANPNSYASLILLSPLSFFLLVLAVASFLEESGNTSQSVKPVVGFLTNNLFKQLDRANSVFRSGQTKSMALNVINSLSSQGYNNSSLWTAVDTFVKQDIKNMSMGLIGFQDTKQLLGTYLMQQGIPNFTDIYLLSKASSTSTTNQSESSSSVVIVTPQSTEKNPVSVQVDRTVSTSTQTSQNQSQMDASQVSSNNNIPPVVSGSPAVPTETKVYWGNTVVAIGLIGFCIYFFGKNKKR